VLLTDGASRLVDPFQLATWEELLALLDENGPDELLRQVRAAEAVDPEGRQWPRTKRSDDATAIYLALDKATTQPWPSRLEWVAVGRRRGWMASPFSVSRRAGGVCARREHARRRGHHRRLTTSLEGHRTDRLGLLLDQFDRAREIAQARLDGLASPASLPEGEPLPPRKGDGPLSD
jgi:hypothetical protein